MRERNNITDNPYFYPHKKGDIIINLHTGEEGIIETVEENLPLVNVKVENGHKTWHLMDIANKGNLA